MAAAKLSPFIHLKRTPHLFSFLLQSLSLSSAPQNYSPPPSLRQSLNPSTLIELLNSEISPTSAVNLFRWASRQKNFHQTSETYAHLISKLGLTEETEEMETFLKEMVRFHYPDGQSVFESLIESFCGHRRPREAFKVFQNATLAKFKLRISTCNALMNCLVEERFDLGSVVFVYKEMVKDGILPNVDTLNCLIRSLVENGMVELALEQFKRMEKKNCKPSCLTFEVLIGGFCSSGRVDEAVEIWKQMLEVGCNRSSEFYAGVIPWFCRVGRLDEAMELFELMKGDGFLPGLCLSSVLIHSLCGSLRLDDALEVFEEMRELEIAPSSRVHVDVVNACCKLGRFSEAMSLLEENHAPNSEPYNALLEGLCDGGNIQEAISYLGKIQVLGICNSHSWNILVSSLCKKGNVAKAFEVLSRMVVSSWFPDEVTHSSVISGFCKICSYDRALDWFRQDFVQHHMSLDRDSCSELIKGLCHVDKVHEAIDVFYCVASKTDAIYTDALDRLIRGLCLEGELNEAIKVRSIALGNGTASAPSTYEIVMLALLDSRKTKDMLPFLSQMLVEGFGLTVRTYSILICGLCIECPNCAAPLFNQMIQDGLNPDTKTLEKLVYGATKGSWLHLVVHSLDKVIEDGALDSPTVCNMLICGLVQEGYKKDACKFLDCMLEKGWVPDSITHGLLVGNIDAGGRDGDDKPYEDDDGVSSILSEGLGSSS